MKRSSRKQLKIIADRLNIRLKDLISICSGIEKQENKVPLLELVESGGYIPKGYRSLSICLTDKIDKRVTHLYRPVNVSLGLLNGNRIVSVPVFYVQRGVTIEYPVSV